MEISRIGDFQLMNCLPSEFTNCGVLLAQPFADKTLSVMSCCKTIAG
jgi:hypothetical protein